MLIKEGVVPEAADYAIVTGARSFVGHGWIRLLNV